MSQQNQRRFPAWMGWVGLTLIVLFLLMMMFPGGTK